MYTVHSAPTCGAVGAGAALSVGRHTHRRERGHIHTPGIVPNELLCGVTASDSGDAGSTRWIAFLDRACRRHRQLLSTRGNGHSTRRRNEFSVCLFADHVNPTRTAPSRTPWWGCTPTHNLHQSGH